MMTARSNPIYNQLLAAYWGEIQKQYRDRVGWFRSSEPLDDAANDGLPPRADWCNPA